MIQERVVDDVKDAGLFSVQMNSTQDISTHDQCAIVVRYVKADKAKERLLSLVNVSDSKAPARVGTSYLRVLATKKTSH